MMKTKAMLIVGTMLAGSMLAGCASEVDVTNDYEQVKKINAQLQAELEDHRVIQQKQNAETIQIRTDIRATLTTLRERLSAQDAKIGELATALDKNTRNDEIFRKFAVAVLVNHQKMIEKNQADIAENRESIETNRTNIEANTALIMEVWDILADQIDELEEQLRKEIGIVDARSQMNDYLQDMANAAIFTAMYQEIQSVVKAFETALQQEKDNRDAALKTLKDTLVGIITKAQRDILANASNILKLKGEMVSEIERVEHKVNGNREIHDQTRAHLLERIGEIKDAIVQELTAANEEKRAELIDQIKELRTDLDAEKALTPDLNEQLERIQSRLDSIGKKNKKANKSNKKADEKKPASKDSKTSVESEDADYKNLDLQKLIWPESTNK